MHYRNKLIGSLIHQIRSLMNEIRLSKEKPYSSDQMNIHTMEVKQDDRIQKEILRRDHLNEKELKIDLENQYGRTKWATRLISELLGKRFRS